MDPVRIQGIPREYEPEEVPPTFRCREIDLFESSLGRAHRLLNQYQIDSHMRPGPHNVLYLEMAYQELEEARENGFDVKEEEERLDDLLSEAEKEGFKVEEISQRLAAARAGGGH